MSSWCLGNAIRAGSNTTLCAEGNRGHRIALFLATRRAKPVTIPGWNGQWELGGNIIPLFLTRLDATGRLSIPLKIPSVNKITLHLQSASAAPGATTRVDLGCARTITIY